MVISLYPLPFFVWVWIAVRGRRRNLTQGAGSNKTGTDYSHWFFPNSVIAPFHNCFNFYLTWTISFRFIYLDKLKSVLLCFCDNHLFSWNFKTLMMAHLNCLNEFSWYLSPFNFFIHCVALKNILKFSENIESY